jgi:hypothetical protein
MLKMPEHRVDLHLHGLVMSVDELWLRCFALGSMNTARELEAFLRGRARPTRHEHNVIAVALNEYFDEIGLTKFVPYVDDDATPIAEHRLRSAAILAPAPFLLTPPDR